MPRALRPFRSPDYRILALALAVSLFGSGMWAVAMVYEVIELGGDELALSAVGTATSVGLIGTALLGGIAADRMPRRWILRGVEALNVVAVGTSALLSALGLIEVWHLALTGAMLGAATGFFFPAYSAILPSILPEDELLAANGIEGMGRPVLTQAAGPAVAGMVTAAISPGSAITWIALCHLLALIGLLRLHPRVDGAPPEPGDAGYVAVVDVRTGPIPITGTVPPPVGEADEPGTAAAIAREAADASAPGPPTSVVRDLADAVRFMVRTPWLLWTLIWSSVIVFAYIGPFEVLTPFLLRDRLGLGSDAFGLVLASFGVGAAGGSLLMASLRLPRRYLTLMLASWGLPLGLFAAFGFADELWQLIVIAVVIGATGGIGGVIWGTLLQRRVPREMLGRMSSLDFFVSLAFMPVSIAIVGPIAKAVAIEWIFVAVAAISVVMTAIAWVAGRFWADELAHPLDADGEPRATDRSA
ncbi:MAG: MFS transporter [Microbacteriaceae bacterium]|nr:MFS transporter [Microbacteriaceae bacterium]